MPFLDWESFCVCSPCFSGYHNKSASAMSSSSSPCAACKLQRRKCTQECIFAPYFPADQPQKFAYIHKVFGASNISKLLSELDVSQREDAVNSLAYEAETRLREPIYGCVGLISALQQRLKVLQSELHSAKKELSTYIGPQALLPMIQPQPTVAYNMGKPPGTYMGGVGGGQMMAGPSGPHPGALMIREQPHQAAAAAAAQQQQQQQQQVFEAQQMAAAREQQQEMYRRQQDMKFNGGFDHMAAAVAVGGGPDHYGHGGVVSPSLALGGPFEGQYHHHIQGGTGAENQHPHHHLQAHHLSLQPQQQMMMMQEQPTEHMRSGSEEKSSAGGPSC